MSLRISTHAIERYVQRIDPTATWHDAREIMLEAMSTASRMKQKTYAGDTVFAAPSMRLIVAEENGHREVITVLQPEGSRSDDIPELAEQLAAEFAEWERTQVIERTTPRADGEEITPDHFRGSASHRKLAAGITRRQQLISVLLVKLSATTAEQKPPPKPNPSLAHELHQAKAQLAAAERRLAVQVAHARRMEEDREAWKRCCGRMLKCLLSEDPAGALAEAEQECSGFVDYIRKASDSQEEPVSV